MSILYTEICACVTALALVIEMSLIAQKFL